MFKKTLIMVIDKSTIYNKNIQKHHLEAKFGKSEATLFYATFKVEEYKVSSDFLNLASKYEFQTVL